MRILGNPSRPIWLQQDLLPCTFCVKKPYSEQHCFCVVLFSSVTIDYFCYYRLPLLSWTTSVIIDYFCYYWILLLLLNTSVMIYTTSVTMDFLCYYEVLPLLRTTSVIPDYFCYYGRFLLSWTTSVIVDFFCKSRLLILWTNQ